MATPPNKRCTSPSVLPYQCTSGGQFVTSNHGKRKHEAPCTISRCCIYHHCPGMAMHADHQKLAGAQQHLATIRSLKGPAALVISFTKTCCVVPPDSDGGANAGTRAAQTTLFRLCTQTDWLSTRTVHGVPCTPWQDQCYSQRLPSHRELIVQGLCCFKAVVDQRALHTTLPANCQSGLAMPHFTRSLLLPPQAARSVAIAVDTCNKLGLHRPPATEPHSCWPAADQGPIGAAECVCTPAVWRLN